MIVTFQSKYYRLIESYNKEIIFIHMTQLSTKDDKTIRISGLGSPSSFSIFFYHPGEEGLYLRL